MGFLENAMDMGRKVCDKAKEFEAQQDIQRKASKEKRSLKSFKKLQKGYKCSVQQQVIEVIPNGNHFTVVDEDGFAMVRVKHEFDAETALKEHVLHCQELYRRTL